jgi:hypothetical protein
VIMPIPPLTAIGALLVGGLLGNPINGPAAAMQAPEVRPVNLRTEMSAPMFRGTVQAIDRTALRVTVQTDFGRLVPVAVGSCDILSRLRVGDRVRLDVDAQGIVRRLNNAGAYFSTTPNPLAAAQKPGPCPEASL